MPLAVLCLALLPLTDQAPVKLARRFAANEKLAYAVRSHLTTEQRQRGLQTWLPSDTDINYNFTYTVKGIQADGIAVLGYQRPTMTFIENEDGDQKTTVEKSNWNLRLVLSPINEVIDVKDTTPPKKDKDKDKKKPAEDEDDDVVYTTDPTAIALSVMGQFAGEAQRLALFIGSLDSAMDFAPRLPLTGVKVGDTWQRTVGYQPQKLKGKDNKTAVQRLDYTFTYMGPMKSENGKSILRVQAKLNYKSDLIDYVKEILSGSNKSILTSLPLSLDATIDYDLDPVTKLTLAGRATSDGAYALNLKGDSDPAVEVKFKGRTDLDLVGRKVVPPVKTKK
jgi:hypothetical protein